MISRTYSWVNSCKSPSFVFFEKKKKKPKLKKIGASAFLKSHIKLTNKIFFFFQRFSSEVLAALHSSSYSLFNYAIDAVTP
jgi:hypothetical protein